MKKKHLYEIDFMRTFIMLGVLSVHTMTLFVEQFKDGSVPYLGLSAFHSSMHITRLAFMFITGLVLFITYYHREFTILSFWKKRLLLIGIPYFFWNIIYLILDDQKIPVNFDELVSFLKELGPSLIHGDQFYIYFVLISFQFYLVFPFLLIGLRKFEKWHKQIFIGSMIFQLLLMAFFKYGIQHVDTASWPYLLSHYGVFVLTYQCWFIAGGMVACHYNEICSFIGKHARAITLITCASLLLIWPNYFFDRFVLLETDHKAQAPHQPIFLPYSLLAITFLFYAGRKWASVRTKPNWQFFSRYIMIASQTSFGMFLVQPFPLYFVIKFVPYLADVKWLYVLAIPISILFVYFSSMLLSYCLNKLPLISYVVGRKSKIIRSRKSVPVQEEYVSKKIIH